MIQGPFRVNSLRPIHKLSRSYTISSYNTPMRSKKPGTMTGLAPLACGRELAQNSSVPKVPSRGSTRNPGGSPGSDEGSPTLTFFETIFPVFKVSEKLSTQYATVLQLQ